MHPTQQLTTVSAERRSPAESVDQPIAVSLIAAGSRKLRSREPIVFRITKDDDRWFAENENLLIYGSGEDAQKALNDAFAHVIHLYDYYSALEEWRATGRAKSLKKRFSALFQE